jgi:hypothetical protein
MQNKNTLFALLFLIIALANIVVHYLAGHALEGQLFNADALYLPTLFADLIGKRGHVGDWFLTPAPYFFPDYPMFLLAYVVGSGPYYQILSFALLQVTLTFVAIWLLARELIGARALSVAGLITVTLVWLALSSVEPFVLLLASAFHYGIFLTSLLLVALWLRGIGPQPKPPHAGMVLMMAALAFFSTLSDSLFVVQLVVPLVAITVFMAFAGRDFSLRNKLPLLVVALAAGLGSWAYRFAVAHPTRYSPGVGTEHMLTNLDALYSLFRMAAESNPILGLCFLGYLGLVAYALYRLVRGAGDKLLWLALFSFLSLGATLSAMVLVDQPVTARYLIPGFSWAVVIVLIVLTRHLGRWLFPVASTACLGVLAFLTFGSYTLVQNNGLAQRFYPAEIACIDQALEHAQVSNGIATYWNAKYLQAFSQHDLTVAQHGEDFAEFRWITSGWYFRPTYDFAVVAAADQPAGKRYAEQLVRINGQPEKIKSCGDKSVYFYGKDRLRVKKIALVGDSFTWKACELPTVIGEATPECGVRKRDIVQFGHLSFGPYEPLPAGRYRVEINFSSQAGKTETAGNWDVVLALPTEAKVLNNGLLGGTDGSIGQVTSEFTLGANQDMQKVEVRTWAEPNIELNLADIRLTRVQ